MKKIALIAYGPETAYSLKPLIKPLKEEYDVSLFAFHEYAAKIWGEVVQEKQKFRNLFLEEWDAILTGLNARYYIEKATPFLAKEMNIPVISIIDTPQTLQTPIQRLPDYLICPNEQLKRSLVVMGMDEDCVFDIGNPFFDHLKTASEQKSNGVVKPYRVSYFHQLSPSTKESVYHLVKLRDRFPELIGHIDCIGHPCTDNEWLMEFCKYEEKATFYPYSDASARLLQSDVTYGTGSFFQLQSLVVEKPTIVYHTYEQIEQSFKTVEQFQFSKIADFNATNRCVELVKKLV